MVEKNQHTHQGREADTELDQGEEKPEESVVNRSSYLPYPSSTLGPKIVPNDLTNFRSRGVSQVEKELKQQLRELKERYEQVIDDFNWNKLVYEAEFAFEPVMGDTYHLYEGRKPNASSRLSLVPPEEWPGRGWIGSFRLNVDRRWEPTEVSQDFDLRNLAGEEQ